MPDFANLVHPDYTESISDWIKWRRTYEAGDEFIQEYLKKFSNREQNSEFTDRKEISYVPAFATAAVDEVKDAIFQRISDVTRSGGSTSYNQAVVGLKGGVDLSGTTMNSFVGRVLLPELTSMKRVGVFVDMPEVTGTTISEQQATRPYIYHYKTEDILNWAKDVKKNTFTRLLLRNFTYVVDEETELPTGFEIEYRLLFLNDKGTVTVQFFNVNSELINEKTLNLPEIPFVVFELPHSLLKNIANYQIALLNLASADMSYALKSNFPFYVEQYNPKVDNLYGRMPSNETGSGVTIVESGERADSQVSKQSEQKLGTTTGRRYPIGTEPPQFIHPSSEPLLASMKKQDELKKDIRILVNLNISNLTPKMASGESKSFDERSLEAGLSAIGLELEHGERNIAKYWQWYEDKDGEQPTVKYPEKYSLQSNQDTRKEAKDLQESIKGHPSVTYKKEVYKVTSNSLIGHDVSKETMDKINREVDAAKIVVSDPEELNRDLELALVDLEAASLAKGYPKGTVEKAKSDHADRIARIAESQMKARGTNDLGGIENASRAEKIEKDGEAIASRKTRGEA